MARQRQKHLGFRGLEDKAMHEYEKKGRNPRAAREIGRKVAGKVAHEKRERHAHGHHHRASCRCGFCTMSPAMRLRHLEQARATRKKHRK